MILEFGTFVYDNGYEGNQNLVFAKTYPALQGNFDAGFAHHFHVGSISDQCFQPQTHNGMIVDQ